MVSERTITKAKADGTCVLLANVDGNYFVKRSACSHRESDASQKYL